MTKIDFPLTVDAEKLIGDVCQNLPECGPTWAQTVGWNYKENIYKFHDPEEDAYFELDMPTMVIGLQKIVQDAMEGKLPGIKKRLGQMDDAGEWDAWDIDLLIQYSIFGEIVYG